MIQDSFQHKIDTLNGQKQAILPPIESLSIIECKEIIRRYVAVVEGNSQSWLAGASIAARSVLGRIIAQENLWIELKENHASLLRQFAINADAEPDIEDFHAVSGVVERIRKLVAEFSGLKSIALMTIIESGINTYPYLASLARKVGSCDFNYTNVHEIEDMEHAVKFYKALTAEMQMNYSECEKDLDEVLILGMDLYHAVFGTTSPLT